MAPTRYHHGDLRRALLEAAEGLVAERGAHDWSLREVARLVGVSPSAAYHHFRDRRALVAAVIRSGFTVLQSSVERDIAQVPVGAEPPARLLAGCRGYMRFALDHQALFRTMFAGPVEPASDGPGEPPDEPLDPGAYAVLQRELDLLVDEGLLTPAVRLDGDVVLWSALHGLATLLLDGQLHLRPGTDPLTMTDLIVGTFVRGLTGRAEAPAGCVTRG